MGDAIYKKNFEPGISDGKYNTSWKWMFITEPGIKNQESGAKTMRTRNKDKQNKEKRVTSDKLNTFCIFDKTKTI